MFTLFLALVSIAFCPGGPILVSAQTYDLSDNWIGSAFFSAFTWQAIADPTGGRVNYVNQATAQQLNLSYANGNTFIARADYTTTLSASGAGRNSVRLQSNKQYTNHVVVVDLRHMPQGCGTWPAVWEVGGNWPYGGEVDIIEGVNDESPNASTLHSGPGCTMPQSRSQTGTTTGTDCDAFDNSNAGCGVQTNKANNYGPSFNSNGGGWYVLWRTSTFMNVYFWSRKDGSVPSEVMNDGSTVTPSNWGTPVANFPNTDCNLSSEFGPNNIVIDLTFCGDWAGGSAYNSAGCSGSCVTYVNDNPGAFANAYWDFAAIRVYT